MPDNKFRARKYETRDQIGVLVGGFQSEADAVKALAILKKWPAPKNEMLGGRRRWSQRRRVRWQNFFLHD